MMSAAVKIALLWPTFDAYHVARFKTVHDRVGDRVVGIEFVGGGGDDETGRWRPEDRVGLPIVTICPSAGMDGIDRHALGGRIVNKLRELEVGIVFVNGYSTPELRAVIDWARRKGKRCFTFFETKADDFDRVFWKEWAKRWILRGVEGALCGGELHRQYALTLGLRAEKVGLGYDVVDNRFFEEVAEEVCRNEAEWRLRCRLPRKYFLSVSRIVKKKNLFGLLDAYKIYREAAGSEAWDWVLCGSGSLEAGLKSRVENEKIAGVNFAGVRRGRDLAVHYACASAFVLASTTEQWGLVINEAMASGVPVLASRNAGAAVELVVDGKTGYVFDPHDSKQIAERMLRMTRLSETERIAMGSRGRERVNQKCPLGSFADGVLRLVGEVL